MYLEPDTSLLDAAQAACIALPAAGIPAVLLRQAQALVRGETVNRGREGAAPADGAPTAFRAGI